MTENEKLRALLAEARRLLHQHATVEAWATRDRIDAALSRVELERWNWEQSAKARERERDEARAEVERLREVIETAGNRLRACGEHLTEHAYQEMASVLFDLPQATEDES